MNTQTSFYVAVFSIILVVAAPYIWFPCGEAESAGLPQQAGDTNALLCPPDPSFEIEFDRTACTIQIDKIGSSSCEIEASVDGGLSWVNVSIGDTLGLTGSGACDVKLRSAQNPMDIVSYSGRQVCNCTPQVNTSIIEDLVEDPLNHFLDGQACSCSDFIFVFPDGTRINAVEITLYLKMNRLNGFGFEIHEVDLEKHQVLLING